MRVLAPGIRLLVVAIAVNTKIKVVEHVRFFLHTSVLSLYDEGRARSGDRFKLQRQYA